MNAGDGPAPDAPGTRAAEVLIGREAWVQALRTALTALPALAPAPREVLLWGSDFGEWPLDEPAVHAALSLWLREPGRRLVLIGHDFDATARRHPRLTRWRRDWSHRIEAWRPTQPVQGEPMGLLLCGERCWQLLDNVHWRTRIVSDAPMLRAWREQSDACLQRCEPCWPPTTLGL
ncbi:hypothetical protein AACH10_18295 [Ideonella sp. DXS22W]|uniref:Uncharacterized protein n=1 Tax=Pseudaquabacterium inlustre TaxID=2984192 RepID=A0ABU9CK70_9BURK